MRSRESERFHPFQHLPWSRVGQQSSQDEKPWLLIPSPSSHCKNQSFDRSKGQGLRDTWVLTASALLLGAPSSSSSVTGNKLLANIVFVIKRLRDIIPKYKRNHSQITRPAREALKYTGFLFHALFALIVILVSITVHCSIQKKSSLYQESTEQGGER